MSKVRRLMAMACVAACVAAARAGPDDATTSSEATAVRQAQLKRTFEQFRVKLAVLAGRLESNTDPKQREKAKAMRAALKEASDRAVESKFDSLVRGLSSKGADQNLDVLTQIVRENQELRDDLRRMLALLTQDDRDRLLKDRREEAIKLRDVLVALRDEQARAQAQTDRGRKDLRELAPGQKKLTERTKDLLDELDAPAKDAELAARMRAVKRPVGEANGQQKKAEGKLSGGDREGAGDAQGEAAARLGDAVDELDDVIRQTRREEQERRLQDLLARAKKMLDVEKDVRTGAEVLYRERSGKKAATVEQAARADRLAGKQLENQRECEAASKLVRDEGAAVAFLEVFGQIERDMDAAQRRLARAEVDSVTVAVVEDVVETLKDVVKALEKAIRQNQDAPRPPRVTDGPAPGPRPLVERLDQLKMIHALQKRVNARTELYGRHYDGEQVPQADDQGEREQYDGIRRELGELAGRQERLARVTRELGNAER